MPVEHSAGIIIFRNTPEGRRYLVLRSSRRDPGKPDFWDFTKEVLEAGETGMDAARRAAKEEAGIDNLDIVPDFKETVQYFTRREGKSIPKFVAMFLAETKKDGVTLSWEHDRYEWLSYEEALGRVSNPKMKKALESAEKFLQSHDRI